MASPRTNGVVTKALPYRGGQICAAADSGRQRQRVTANVAQPSP